MSKIFVSIDFESHRPGDWVGFGCVIVTYPEGDVLDSLEVICDRSKEPWKAETLGFWHKHPTALDYLLKRGSGMDPLVAENQIVEYILYIKSTFPGFYLISDNPSFDVGMLNNILLRHGHSVVADRVNGLYHQTICTWSTRLAYTMMSGVGTKHLDDHYAKKLGNVHRNVHSLIHIRHTPVSDCAYIIYNHFKVLDLMGLRKKNAIASKSNLDSNRRFIPLPIQHFDLQKAVCVARHGDAGSAI